MRVRWVLIVPVAAVALLWDGLALPPHLPDPDLGLTGPVYGNIVLVSALVVLVALSQMRRLRVYLAYAPWVMFGALVAYVAVRAWHDFPVLWESLAGMSKGAATTGLWSAMWYVVPVLFVGSVLVAIVPCERFWTFGIFAFPLVLLALAYIRGVPYGPHPGDSASRMLMHVVPLVVLFLMVAAGSAQRVAFPESLGPGTPEDVRVDAR
jgi:hypothetical protein